MFDQMFIIATLALFVVVGLFFNRGKKASIDGFALARNRLHWFPIAAGISMTFAGGATILNSASLGYSFGWYALVDPIALSCGILVVVFFLEAYRNDNGITLSDLLSGSSKKLSFLIGVITSVVFLLILAAQFVALTKLISPYFPNFNHLLITTLISTLVFGYVFRGGFASVTRTDVVQLVFIVVFLFVPLAYYIYSSSAHQEEVNNAANQFAKMPTDLIILLSIPLVFIPLSQDINLRSKSAKTKGHAIIGLLLGAAFYFTIVAASAYLGISMARAGVTIDDAEQTFSTFFLTNYPGFGVIAILSALAAIVSSLDSYALNAITAICRDLLSNLNAFKSKKQQELINMSALIVFVSTLGIALFFNAILTLILAALLIYVSILLPIALAKRLRINDDNVFYISVLSIAAIVLLEYFGIEYAPKALMYPAVGMSLFLIFHFTVFKKES